MQKKQSYSTSEVARYCHVTADTIRKWALADRIAVFKTPGGHRRIRHEELLRFLRENSIPVHSDLQDAQQRVLIIDDDQSSAAIIRRFLDRVRKQVEIEEASDPFLAGHRLATFRPDVIFLNLSMAGLDGLLTCQRIKALPEHAGARIIAIGSSHDSVMNGRAMEIGVSVVMRKPFTPDDLRRSLAKTGVEVS
jgi:excisionase family DNA binding protein